jgi:hypothetical protein
MGFPVARGMQGSANQGVPRPYVCTSGPAQSERVRRRCPCGARLCQAPFATRDSTKYIQNHLDSPLWMMLDGNGDVAQQAPISTRQVRTERTHAHQ